MKDIKDRTPLAILNFIKKKELENSYPIFISHIWISLRILLTIPVTVVSCERSFFKLKLIETYLSSTMSQDKLNYLAKLSIEH